MNEKLLQQAIALFDTQEKWDAFLELCNNKDRIRDIWKDALINRIKQRFYADLNTDKWQIWNDKWNLHIYPGQLPKDLMEIRINLWDMRGYVWINKDIYKSNKARKMIQSNPNIMSWLDGFEYYNEWDIYNKPFANDIREHTLDSSYYKWGNDTEHVAEAIFETYLHPFMTDGIADFFAQICSETKKDEQ